MVWTRETSQGAALQAAKIGVPRDEATRKKLSEAAKAYYARRRQEAADGMDA